MSAGLRDFVKAISPKWLSDGVAEKFLYLQGLDSDACLEKMNQGMQLHMPTYGDPSALPAIGADRVIPQGFNEPALSYAARLKIWLDDWAIAGNARATLQQALAEVLPQLPRARTVSDSSVWDTYIQGPYTSASAPATSYPSHYVGANNWNWDGEADPKPLSVAKAWWRWWLIMFADLVPVGGGVTAATNASPIQITTSSAHGLATNNVVWITGVNGNLGANSPQGNAAWTITKVDNTNFTLNGSIGTGAYTAGGTVYLIGPNNWILPAPSVGAPGVTIGDARYSVGFSLPNGQPNATGLIAGLNALVALWKSAHSWCRWKIVSFDNNRFDPAQTADGTHNPDGTWGPWVKIVTVNSIPQYVGARSPDARYADPVV